MGRNQNAFQITRSLCRVGIAKLCRRRKFVVKPRLQYSLLLLALSYVLFFLLVTGAALFLPLVLQLRATEPLSREAAEAARNILYLHSNFWPAALLSIAAIALHSIRTSHKVAGPLYRFSGVFEAVKGGRIPKRIQLRKGDYLHEEMGEINAMLESLRAAIGDIEKAQESLQEAVYRRRERGSSDLVNQEHSYVEDVVAKANNLARATAKFRIEA